MGKSRVRLLPHQILEIQNYHHGGYSYTEIAEAIGCSKSAVRYHCNPNSRETSKAGATRRYNENKENKENKENREN